MAGEVVLMAYKEMDKTREIEQECGALAASELYHRNRWNDAVLAFDEAIHKKDIYLLAELYQYINDECEDNPFMSIPENKRIINIIDIIMTEYKDGITPLWNETSNYMELYEKYMSTLFSLRRINLSNCNSDFVKDAERFLESTRPSNQMIEILVSREIL